MPIVILLVQWQSNAATESFMLASCSPSGVVMFIRVKYCDKFDTSTVTPVRSIREITANSSMTAIIPANSSAIPSQRRPNSKLTATCYVVASGNDFYSLMRLTRMHSDMARVISVATSRRNARGRQGRRHVICSPNIPTVVNLPPLPSASCADQLYEQLHHDPASGLTSRLKTSYDLRWSDDPK